ncbi:biotin--[acetyl-CoA-carboxylase] ligase [Streptococcus sciuri]|uniref:biotin--[biotin carboxyl-carrier protein] ligase n=1 Tax=Streptococcus sciuri TaxID=2973939 RepID=A0ABT2F4N8_9STRE|nr:biotin--[acetyl-CoA-carboxylase] ligase [Streptococcus sciuri]MCS4487434.1 biotin--[acetyl-CoA-carboxylase] ligase [Streptococcus sciuri]
MTKRNTLCTDKLDPLWLQEQLGFAVTLIEKSQSTQQDTKRAKEKGELNSPHLFLANNQTAAVGRFSRPFFASNNQGIYMSLYLPVKTQKKLPTYTLMVASSIVKAIWRLTQIDTQIKWVNDIYRDGKKIAGILTETTTHPKTGQRDGVIIGVGINFAITTFPKELEHKAGNLFEGTPTISRNALIKEIWHLFLSVPEHDLIKVYKEKSLVLGRRICFNENGTVFTGEALDILNSGTLVVKLNNDKVKYLSSGEISLSSWSNL